MKKYVSLSGIVIVAILGVFVLSGCAHTGNNKSVTPGNISAEPSVEVMEKTEGENEIEGKNEAEGESLEKNGMEKGENSYAIGSDSSVSYSAQKKWLSKPTEKVVGTNTAVKGQFYYNATTGVLADLAATVDSQTFDSGSAGRDKEVQGILNGNIVIKTKGEVSGIVSGTFGKTIPLEVTINGVSNNVDFVVKGEAGETSFMAEGSAEIDLEDFDIKPFSVLGLYEVDKMLGISFVLKSS